MLPGVELARRRRVHYHGDVAAGDPHHPKQARGGAGGLTGPALAARTRLEEKLRGAGPPSTSRWTGLMRGRDGRRRGNSQEQQEQEHQVPSSSSATSTEHWPPPPTNSSAVEEALPRAVVVELCAVCLDEVRDERVTRLPCSHQYHSDCVLPWLAIQPDCPCCRTLVPHLHTLS